MEWLFESGRLWRGESVHKILKQTWYTGTIFISEIIRDYNSTSNPVEQKTYEMDGAYPIAIYQKRNLNLVQQLMKHADQITVELLLVKIIEELKKSNIFNSVCRCARCGEAMYHNVALS